MPSENPNNSLNHNGVDLPIDSQSPYRGDTVRSDTVRSDTVRSDTVRDSMAQPPSSSVDESSNGSQANEPSCSSKGWLLRLGQAKRFIVHDILQADDSPHRLALGAAVGFFVAFTPTMPFQMLLTIGIAWLVGANKTVGLPVVWLTNPATFVPIYFPQYLLGSWIMGRSVQDVNFGTLINTEGDMFAYAGRVWDFTLEVFEPLWIGSLIVALTFAICSYCLTRQAIISYRRKRYGRRDMRV